MSKQIRKVMLQLGIEPMTSAVTIELSKHNCNCSNYSYNYDHNFLLQGKLSSWEGVTVATPPPP